MRTSDGISKKQYDDLCKIIDSIVNDMATKYEIDRDVATYLNENPFPDSEGVCENKKRIYYLLLNRLKNWVAREQSKKDGGQYWKNKFKKIPTGSCQECGIKFQLGDEFEFHHTLRDGRKPIPLHKKCHNKLGKTNNG